MIKSYSDYLEYLEEDRKACFGENVIPTKKQIKKDYRYRFELALRKWEYYHNCCPQKWKRASYLLAKKKYNRLALICGFTIPINIVGKGLSIAHRGTIIINGNASVGDYCRIHACVNIGVGAGSEKAPRIGNGVYIGPGAKLFGDIEIADNIAIGANAVVNKSFLTPGVSIAGVPARQISGKGTDGILYKPKSMMKSDKDE